MKFCTAIVFLASAASTTNAFAPKKSSTDTKPPSALNIVVGDTAEEFAARVEATFEKATPKDPGFEEMVRGSFPGAISNQDLVTGAVGILARKGYNGENTLLATSLCCDELARQLEDDFNGIYGNNFNLGGLAGFPFAGKTGFGAMAAHIPDDGYCLVVYGPHVGVATDGTVGKVERSGIALVDTCCGSAVAASGYVDSILSGTKDVSTGIQGFVDFQQQGVQELILPHGKRLADAGENRMIELPYALYDSQDVLLTEIVEGGSTGIKRGLAMLGGIQINTGPDTPDYFVPLKFDYLNYRGEVTADLLPGLLADQEKREPPGSSFSKNRDDDSENSDGPATEDGGGGEDNSDERDSCIASPIEDTANTETESDATIENEEEEEEHDGGDGDIEVGSSSKTIDDAPTGSIESSDEDEDKDETEKANNLDEASDKATSGKNSSEPNPIIDVETFAVNDDNDKVDEDENPGEAKPQPEEDHLSWMTISNPPIAGITAETTREYSASSIEPQQTIDNDEDNYYVDDTYLLGEQIASALKSAQIDIVGAEDHESIAPILADALLLNVETDANNKNNEGWNQFGAESLYSIGGDEVEMPVATPTVDEFGYVCENENDSSSDDPLTDELLRNVSIETAASAKSGDGSEFQQGHFTGEEIALVADALVNIINRGVDGQDDDKEEETPVESVNTNKGKDDDNEPPTSHRYVLQADGLI